MHKGNWCHSFKCLLITQCRPILTLFLWRTLINVLTERRVHCGGQLKTGVHSGQRGGAAFQKSWSKVWPVADASRPARQGFNNLSEAFFFNFSKVFSHLPCFPLFSSDISIYYQFLKKATLNSSWDGSLVNTTTQSFSTEHFNQ